MHRGFAAFTTAAESPRRSKTPGAKFSTNTSASRTSSNARLSPAADFKSIHSTVLPRLSRRFASLFQRGPPGGSTCVTLAPASTQSHWEMQGFNVQFSTQQLHRKLEHGCLCSWNRLMACTALPARRRAVKGPAMYWPKSRTRMPRSARPLDASCDMCTRAAVSTDQARRAVSRTNS